MDSLTLNVLKEAFRTGAAGIRATTVLQPLGGKGDKVFPPTFGDSVVVPWDLDRGYKDRRRTKYAVEQRMVGGRVAPCVLLDSVASQANRFEEALLEGWERGELRFPLVRVDFTSFDGDHATRDVASIPLNDLGGDGFISALEAPHRLADALLRDSLLDGTLFRASPKGRWFGAASPSNATAIFALCPTALVFGMWDSTGPKGGLGAKFQRALVSEIVGIDIALGSRTSSRIDPAGIEGGVKILRAASAAEGWTIVDPEAAPQAPPPKQEGGSSPELYKGGGGKAGAPAAINHGNIKPSVDEMDNGAVILAGGVTLDHAVQRTILSLPALRRLRFRTSIDGTRLEGAQLASAEDSARLVLASLALAAVACQRARGYDLRSRCAFQAQGPLVLEVLGRDGGVQGAYSLSSDEAKELFAEASREAAAAGMEWDTEPIDLQPTPKLVGLIRRSRANRYHETVDPA